MSLLITSAGHAAIISASTGGFLLSITEFAVGDGQGFTPMASMTTLHGTELYRGTITNVQAIATDTIQYVCEVPDSVPAPGTTIDISEIGIYTDTGILFAIGEIQPYHIKQNGVIFRIIPTVNLSNCTDVLEVNINTHMSLPYVPRLTALPSPHGNVENAVLVGDAYRNDPHTDPEYSSTIAVKYGGSKEITEWGFIGYTRVLRREQPTVLAPDRFSVSTPGAWFYNNEIVLVQVVSGASVGQTRRFRYNTSTDEFTQVSATTTPPDMFYNFTDADRINVWRNIPDAFPSLTGIPDGFTLQVGDGTPMWGSPGGSMPLSSFSMFGTIEIFRFTGDGITKVFTLPHNNICSSIVTVAGSVQEQSAYVTLGNELIFMAPPCVGEHECVLFIPTAPVSGGVQTTLHRETYITSTAPDPVTGAGYNTANTDLILANGPATADELLVFHAHTYRDHDDWTYDPATKTITWMDSTGTIPTAPVDGVTEVYWFDFVPTVDSVTFLRKFGYISDGIQQNYRVPVPITADNIMVFTQGAYYESGSMGIIGTDTVQLQGVIPKAGRPIEIVVFENTLPHVATGLQRDDPNVSILNSIFCPPKDGDLRTLSGKPQMFLTGSWRTLRESQVPHVTKHIGNGVQFTFDIGVVPKWKENVRVNVDGNILMVDEYGVDGTTLTLNLSTPLESGRRMEVIAFDYWML